MKKKFIPLPIKVYRQTDAKQAELLGIEQEEIEHIIIDCWIDVYRIQSYRAQADTKIPLEEDKMDISVVYMDDDNILIYLTIEELQQRIESALQSNFIEVPCLIYDHEKSERSEDLGLKIDDEFISVKKMIDKDQIEMIGETIPIDDFREENKIWTSVGFKSGENVIVDMPYSDFLKRIR